MITSYRIIPIVEVKPADILSMYDLMGRHYNNVFKEKFIRDFNVKDGVIALYDEHLMIKGFSTYRVHETEYQKERIKIIFSGDTVIDVSCWGKSALFEGFIELMVKTYLATELPLYWLLITKGFRTYQIPVLYFKEFYPCFNRLTPAREANIIHKICREFFGNDWHENEQVIKCNPPADYLKTEFAKVDEHKFRNQHVQFFLDKNPGYIIGNEMPCLTLIHPTNFSKLTLKYAKKYGV
jgi:hypothetical protein